MDDARVGRSLRALRTRRGLRQLDIARMAGLSQSAISLIERGHLSSLSIRSVRAAFAALDAGFESHVVWRGGEVERVVDERHAELVTAIGSPPLSSRRAGMRGPRSRFLGTVSGVPSTSSRLDASCH